MTEYEQAAIDLATVNRELQKFETLYETTSERFYELWRAGKLSDTFTFNAWAILIESRNDLQRQIEGGAS